MRKLKLQVQMTVNGYVGGPNGELDWMTWNWDDRLKNYVNELHSPVDTILLGRKMTGGFISHWLNVITKPDDPDFEIAKKMIDIPKVVFSKTLDKSNWINTTLSTGVLAGQVNTLKNKPGKDIIVYGGASFVSSLIRENLIDDYYLFINPIAIKKGLTIFGDVNAQMNLKPVETFTFDCSVTVLHFKSE